MNALKKSQEENIKFKNIWQFSFIYCSDSYSYILFLFISDCYVQIRRKTDASSFVKLLNALQEVYINIICCYDQHIHEWENFYFWSCRFFFFFFNSADRKKCWPKLCCVQYIMEYAVNYFKTKAYLMFT